MKNNSKKDVKIMASFYVCKCYAILMQMQCKCIRFAMQMQCKIMQIK